MRAALRCPKVSSGSEQQQQQRAALLPAAAAEKSAEFSKGTLSKEIYKLASTHNILGRFDLIFQFACLPPSYFEQNPKNCNCRTTTTSTSTSYHPKLSW